MALRYLVSAHGLMMLYIYTNFHENISKGLKELLSRQEIMMVRQMDRQGDYYSASVNFVRWGPNKVTTVKLRWLEHLWDHEN